MTTPADQKRRYSRQTCLAEIGERGQAKLCAATVALHETGGNYGDLGRLLAQAKVRPRQVERGT